MKWKNFVYASSAILLALSLTGCVSKPRPKILAPVVERNEPRMLVVFFDGTSNDETSDTNIEKLHSLVTLQNRREISTFYVEGVGTNGKVIGMATGLGIKYRVILAYKYLAENYRKGDKVYLFGYSRGAYAARILASLLYHAGLPEQPLSTLEKDKKYNDHFGALIYDAFKAEVTSDDRKSAVNKAVFDNDLPHLNPVEVTFMGLWETVEALGLPDGQENIDEPSRRYGDQLCNVRRAAHALALDDNRAREFTPILLTRKHLVCQCKKDINGRDWKADPKSIQERLNETVREVWFTGAHSDVGGGYLNSLLSGVSLNWMISQIPGEGKDSLLALGAGVREDPDENVHDPEKGLLWGALYKRLLRNFAAYTTDSPYNNGKMKVHSTVILRLQKPERLETPISAPRESQWLLPAIFQSCFTENKSGGFDYKKDRPDDCNLVIENDPSEP